MAMVLASIIHLLNCILPTSEMVTSKIKLNTAGQRYRQSNYSLLNIKFDRLGSFKFISDNF